MATEASAPVRVAVLGARGRMGTHACAAIEAAPDLELVAAIGRGDPLTQLVEARADVAVDLTLPDAVAGNVDFCVGHGISVVVGTSGFDTAAMAEPPGGDGPSVLVVPNFAVGAVLMMHVAALAAPHFDAVEIVELHHPGKADAPSGTATRTAEVVARARRDAGVPPAPDATDPDRSRAGARGAAVDGVPVHSVRLPGLVAHQEVLFGSAGETLTVRHDSYDRASFMPGLLVAVREVRRRPGLTVGLEHVLGLTGPAPA